jgi:hypothetical protein
MLVEDFRLVPALLFHIYVYGYINMDYTYSSGVVAVWASKMPHCWHGVVFQ